MLCGIVGAWNVGVDVRGIGFFLACQEWSDAVDFSDGEMKANYAYILDKCRAFSRAGRILDYGCGGGLVVESGRAQGLDIVGVEAFYAGSKAKDIAGEKGLLGSVVFQLQDDGAIPFDDSHFSLVVSNQVFEHVTDLDRVLAEVFRVLKPGGLLLTLFPALEVWREGHCGVPFAHWFERNSRLRHPYMRFMRRLGLGYFKNGKTQVVWARDFIDWLDKYTVYRTYPEIMTSFARVTLDVRHIEDDYIAFRLRYRGLEWAAGITRVPFFKQASRFACRRLAGMVLVASKSQ